MSVVNTRCHSCDEPLEIKFDLGSVPRNWFQTQRSGFFGLRYEPFYSYLKTNPALCLGEGQTSLLSSVLVTQKIGLKELFFKNETQNPTWTFKDRGTACSVQNASALGYKRFGTLSSGNMGASVAAYGGRAGMDTFIMLKDTVPREKIEAVKRKLIPADSRVVVVVTGSGLKYPPVLKEFNFSPVSVELDQLPQALAAVMQ